MAADDMCQKLSQSNLGRFLRHSVAELWCFYGFWTVKNEVTYDDSDDGDDDDDDDDDDAI